MLLGSTPRDYDIVLTAPEDLKLLESVFHAPSFILGKKSLQTFRMVTGDRSFDIMFLEGTIEQDLGRRDFTMNAIAYDVKKDAIIDPYDGIGDIRRRIIRYPKKESIRDDPLRMIKAIRHHATLPDFSMHEDLLRSIRECGHLIGQTAPERIRYEMDLIMTSGNVYNGIRCLDRTGLLFRIFPELISLREMDLEQKFELETYGHTIEGFGYLHENMLLYGITETELKCVGYALLFHDLGKAVTLSRDEAKKVVHFFYHERHSCEAAHRIMQRLRFSTHDMKIIQSLIEHHMRIFLISDGEATEKATRRLVYKLGDLIPLIIVHTLCDMYGSSKGCENESTSRVKQKCGEILNVYREWKKEPLPRLVNGHDLLSMGFGQGRMIGVVLEEVRERQIGGEIRNREAALAYAGECLERLGGGDSARQFGSPDSK